MVEELLAFVLALSPEQKLQLQRALAREDSREEIDGHTDPAPAQARDS